MNNIISLYLLVLFYFNNINALNFTIPTNEFIALEDLYRSTNGTYWIWKNETIAGFKWNFTSNISPCLWQGLSCTCLNNTNDYHPYKEDELLHGDNGYFYANYYDDQQLFPISSKCNIDKIYLIRYNMSGILPEIFDNFNNLTHIHIMENSNLIGQIPNTLGSIKSLKLLSLHQNNFHNTIPSSFKNLIELEYMNLGYNNLIGEVPDFSNLIQLRAFRIDVNKLTGKLFYLNNLTKLDYLTVYNNRLSGRFPDIYNLVLLEDICWSVNLFTGPIPHINNLTNLDNLFIDQNKHTSHIPDYSNLLKIRFIYLYQNELTGTIPTVVNFTNLLSFKLWGNKLTGEIPEFTGCSKLVFIELNYNKLKGTIPTSISTLSNLNLLFLNNNYLTGNLNNVFNASVNIGLNIIDISNNYLTGTLNKEIFQISKINTFIAYTNCMNNVILPIEICNASNLQNLVLDGLKTADKCRNQIFKNPNFPTTYTSTRNVIKNGLPNCLFNMTSLITLSLSGNRMTGTLNNLNTISTILTNLSLSNNEFTGVIPNIFLSRSWVNINLAFNKFRGVVPNSMPILSSNNSLYLNNNRLSGDIPKSLYKTKEINILNGNVFQCTTSRSTLPIYDTGNSHYNCGSNVYNISIITFIIIFIINWMIKTRLWIFFGRMNEETRNNNNIYNIMNWYEWFEYWKTKVLSNLSFIIFPKLYNNKLYILRAAGDNITYISSKSFSTEINTIQIDEEKQKHIDEYFIDSRIAIDERDNYASNHTNITNLCELADGLWKFLRYLMIFLILLLIPTTILKIHFSSFTYSYSFFASFTYLSGLMPGIFMTFLMLLSMILIYSLLKLLFLTPHEILKVDLQSLNKIQNLKEYLIIFTVSLIDIVIMIIVNILYVKESLNNGGGRLIFIEIGLSIFKTIFKQYAVPKTFNFMASYMINYDNDKINKSFIIAQCGLGIINNIIIPIVATAAVSPYCFYHVFVQSQPVESTFSYYLCRWFDTYLNTCVEYKLHNKIVSYAPPFIYSYSCSSSIATTYSSVFIYMSILQIILYPLIQIFNNNIRRLYRHLNPSSKLHRLLKWILPTTFKPIIDISVVELQKNRNVYIFNQSRFIVDIILTLATIVTIGIIIPPLGLIMCSCLYLYIHNTLSNLGYRISQSGMNQVELVKLKKIIEKDCENIKYYCIKSLNIFLIPFTGLFFPIFIFDILGDDIGNEIVSKNIFIIMVILGIIYLSVQFYNNIIKVNRKKSLLKEMDNYNDDGLEMN